MKNGTICFIYFICWFLPVTAAAQEMNTGASISYQIRGDYPIQPLPKPEWIILEGENSLSIQDVRSGNLKDARIIDGSTGTPLRSGGKSSYWYMLQLSSEILVNNWKMVIDRQPPDLSYNVDQAISRLSAYYFKHDQLTDIGYTGREVPTSQRDLDDFYFQSVLLFDLAENDTLDVWINVEAPPGPISASITIHNRDFELSAVPWPFKATTFYYYMGFLTTLIIIGIFLFIWFREKVYVWFLSFLLLNVITILIWKYQTFLIQLFAPDDPMFGQLLGFNMDFLKWTVLLLFGRVFINTKKYFPRLDKTLLVFTGLFYVVGVIMINLRINPSLINNPAIIILLFLFILLPILGILLYFIFSKNKLARFFSIGAIIPFVGIFVIGLFREIIWVRTLSEVLMSVGPMITLTLAVVYRFRLESQGRVAAEKERSRLLENQTELLEQQVEKRTVELSRSLENLKAAQDQLIQQEKLASLGQLTAGIAHEIKNPLNFVNNFSEVSIEMVEEAREEVKGQTAEGKGQKRATPHQVDGAISENDKHHSHILEILDDIEANLRKIHEHGSRADGIVKSMLQHSRGGDGKMEPADLNALVKEYVNLAFHGMRAGKDPIDVDIDLQPDESIGEVPLITEDFSRVILNLVNNSFDAMRDKQAMEGGSGTGYVPQLSVRTHQTEGSAIIEIEDNGPGIPDEIKNKILQPFFTTKKGTAGTGLGLSITNDIVKAHGGRMEIYSQPGQTVFTIKLIG